MKKKVLEIKYLLQYTYYFSHKYVITLYEKGEMKRMENILLILQKNIRVLAHRKKILFHRKNYDCYCFIHFSCVFYLNKIYMVLLQNRLFLTLVRTPDFLWKINRFVFIYFFVTCILLNYVTMISNFFFLFLDNNS